MTNEAFVTIGYAARFLGVSETTIVRMFDQGKLDGHTLPSGHRRVSWLSLEAIRERGQA